MSESVTTPTSKNWKGRAAGGGAAVIAVCVSFTPLWEGFDPVAKPDAIGTGHPMTYCYGQTDEFGTVKAGTRFTRKECDDKIRESMEKVYYPGVHACVTRPLPVKTEAALVDAAYNAGIKAVCSSSMLADMNAGDLIGGCNAFAKFAITTQHGKMIVQGLINRRGGNPDETRKTEKALCLEGVAEGLPVDPVPAPAPQPAPQPTPSLWDRILSFFIKLFGGK
jgi:lysozyme